MTITKNLIGKVIEREREEEEEEEEEEEDQSLRQWQIKFQK